MYLNYSWRWLFVVSSEDGSTDSKKNSREELEQVFNQFPKYPRTS